MSSSADNYDKLEKESALNFCLPNHKTKATSNLPKRNCYDDTLSKHLSSRKKSRRKLNTGTYAMTTLRAGIIVGSGSASFEIIRDLVNKLTRNDTPNGLTPDANQLQLQMFLNFIKIITKSC
jgi:hypothetical protein